MSETPVVQRITVQVETYSGIHRHEITNVSLPLALSILVQFVTEKVLDQ